MEISFLSRAFGGRITDTELTNRSGFLKYLEPGDQVLADKGFPRIEQDVNAVGGFLVMPPLKRKGRQFFSDENKKCYEIASVRVDVERAIQRMKVFEILHFVRHHLLEHIDKILIVIAAMCNCRNDLIKQD